jgi:hypothetical protein
MVGSVNNPNTGVTGFMNDVTAGVGQTVQGANQVKAGINDQQAIYDSTGTTKSLEAQRAESAKSDANGAALIGLQGEETRRKQTQDVLNAIQSGKEDSTNKKISATAQNAKGISF